MEQFKAAIRLECRGLVLDRNGAVAARVLHKVFNVKWNEECGVENSMEHLRQQQVVEVLEKLDGQMVFGVLIGGIVQLWTRRGHGAVAISAERLVMDRGTREMDLVSELAAWTCDDRRATVTFEYVGAQSRIKADEGKQAQLVVIAIRNDQTGRYWSHERILGIAVQHGVSVVKRFPELESLGFEGLVNRVRQWKNREGVVVRFGNQHMVKVKSRWWFQTDIQPTRRWSNATMKEADRKQREKRQRHCETVPQRAVITNAANSTTSQDIFAAVPWCSRVDMVRDRYDGHLTAVVMGFQQALTRITWEELEAACVMQQWRLVQARSRRSVSNERHEVKTQYK
jgi:hypothetical protein